MELSETETDELLRRARQGDDDSAAALVEMLHPTISGVVHRCGARREDACDLVQEALVKVFQHLDQLEGGGRRLHAWARRIALTTCLNRRRWWQARPELRVADLSDEQADLLERSANSSSVEDIEALLAARDLVAQMLERLDPRDRLIIELLELEECGLDEIRQLTGWSRVNARVRAFRARRKLRQILRQLLKEND
jgi:RNA polymerase sigma factor (sigma-70 family)